MQQFFDEVAQAELAYANALSKAVESHMQLLDAKEQVYTSQECWMDVMSTVTRMGNDHLKVGNDIQRKICLPIEIAIKHVSS
jgi:hypothetical protein